jgi:4-hydroxy-tetrahydrodipicolinate synthase
MFQGYFTALITPFKNGKVDEKRFQALVEWQIKEGIHGLVPCGTTGESPTLSHAEHTRIVELTVEVAKGKVPVVAGAGSNSTEHAIELARIGKKAGADAALVVTPYYNKPTQEGLYQHFKAINDHVDIPVIIYNIPPRSVVDMSVQTMARLAQLRNIAGVKDATGDVARVSKTRLAIGATFCQMSGEDAIALALLAHGGHGCISVTANVAPRMCSAFYAAWAARDIPLALTYQDRLMPMHETLFIESNPVPVKYAASLLGLCDPDVRLPLAPLADASKKKVEEAMRSSGLLN